MQKERKYFPLTDSQQMVSRVLFRSTEKGMVIRTLYSVSGECNVDALKKAFWHLVETQDALRARLHIGWRGLEQYVTDYKPFSIPVVALRDESELEAAIHARRNALKNPLYGGPLYYAAIFTHAGGASLFAIFSHICFDGHSCMLATALLEKYYFAYAAGEAPEDVKRRASYMDFCEDDRRYQRSSCKAQDLAYWRALFRQKPYPQRFLPPPSLRAINSPMRSQLISIDGASYSSVADFCRSCGVSIPYFLAATAALIARRLTGKSKIMFTSLSHGRSTVLQRRMIGMMVNAFPVPFDLSAGQTLREYYTSGYLSYLENVRHSRAGIVGITCSSFLTQLLHGHFPGIIEVHFGLLEIDAEYDNSRFSFRFFPSRFLLPQFYLLFSELRNDNVGIEVRYQSGRYSDERIAQLIGLYHDILTSVISHPERTIAQLVADEGLRG